MNPPSLYAAFGNKHALYLEALARYWQISLAATREALAERPSLGRSADAGLRSRIVHLFFR